LNNSESAIHTLVFIRYIQNNQLLCTHGHTHAWAEGDTFFRKDKHNNYVR